MQTQTNATYAAKFSGYGFFVGMAAMFMLPSLGGVLQGALVGAIFGVGGSALGAALGSFVDSLREKTEGMPQSSSPTLAVISFILGLIGLVAWLLPVAGLPIGIAGMITARKARFSSKRTLALIGMGLSLACLYLSVANGYLGVWVRIKSLL